ncbi:hypothetical protein EON64_05590 [archaeon]|nr:MAG: hypothetical protein EON64_05590 [archaeon]
MAMHDLLLDSTTDIASHPEFADRKTTKSVNGVATTGYFISDFTYAEIKTLRLTQRLSQRTPLYNGLLTIPSLSEIISLVQNSYVKTNRTIGLYIELKQPSFYHSLGFRMEDMLLQQLSAAGYDVLSNNKDAKKKTSQKLSALPSKLYQVNPIIIQCFEPNTLVYLDTVTDVPLVQLLDSLPTSFWTNPQNLANFTTYADALGPNKEDFEKMPYATASSVVQSMHADGLGIHPWTFRGDNNDVPSDMTLQTELVYFYCCLQVDAVFIEFPDQAREVLDGLRGVDGKMPAQCPIDCSAY